MNPQYHIESGGSFWLPRASSTIAATMDMAWSTVTLVAIVFGLIVFGAMFWFVFKYRRKTDDQRPVTNVDHSLKMEIAWTVVPTIIVLALFWVGLQGFLDSSVPPDGAFEIRATAQKWSWSFTYPNGYTSLGELKVPSHRPVKVILSAKDVLHSFYIPEFRVKHDAIPGAYTSVWFEATREGTTTLECTEYCGKDHSAMLATVEMMPGPVFDKWLDESGNEGKDLPPAEWGKKLYVQAGCNACHSLDGSKIVGPSFKGAFGRTEALADGSSLTIDENYLRESILEPQKKIVAGYQPVMPVFKGVLNDKKVDALIAFIKSAK